MHSYDIERDAIRAAAARLLAGTPQCSSGTLTIVTLAQEAGLKRNKLTHKHTDLRDQFRAEVARRHGISEREVALRDELAVLQSQLDQAKQDRDSYRATSEIFARAMHVLTIENTTLRRQFGQQREAQVIPIRN